MKKIIILAAFFVMITGQENFAVRNNFNASFGYFYTSLTPYGEWLEIDGYTVWRPRAIQMDWRPYSIGRWSWTKYGWYWDSYEPFGWAVYHYGRWYYDNYYGWLWMPDYEWGPAWVEWRYNDYYIGWAPLPPYASFRVDVGIYFSFRWNSPYSYWNFVRYNHFTHHSVHVYFIDARKTQKFFANTKYRTNYYYDRGRIINGGITRSYVESRGRNRIIERDFYEVDDPRKIESNRTRTSGDRIYAYRPDERTITREPINERVNIKRGDRSISLERDKVELYNRTVTTERSVESKRNNERIKEDMRSERNVSRSSDADNKLEKVAPNNSAERRVETQRNRNTDGRIQQRIEESVNNRSSNNDQKISNDNKRTTSRESNSSRSERKSDDNNRSRNERSVEKRR